MLINVIRCKRGSERIKRFYLRLFRRGINAFGLKPMFRVFAFFRFVLAAFDFLHVYLRYLNGDNDKGEVRGWDYFGK